MQAPPSPGPAGRGPGLLIWKCCKEESIWVVDTLVFIELSKCVGSGIISEWITSPYHGAYLHELYLVKPAPKPLEEFPPEIPALLCHGCL